ncbi:hypothetical protein BUL40_15580 [Croceivirga radicis]|uniref:Replication initiation protein-like C-terminal domain-containing protein n=1 Tax=Croceivirga radicis TaxID=1929488 RepID=A0A1V6LN96_9FLAO|nr:replication initiation factor domain-containing protein [Croceivirga radicis]OQD41497.1 hypothetical protein BUL40_15580 [Croceivirga radicis]
MEKAVNKGVNVPIRYNGDLLDRRKNYALNMDYLVLNLEGSPLVGVVDCLKIDVADYGTKVFKQKAEITYKDETLGTLLFEPRSTVLDANLCQFQLKNYLFYTKDGKELKKMVKHALDVMGLDYKGVNRLDIALDFSQEQHDFKGLLTNILTENVLISGREKDINFYSRTVKGRIAYTGVQIGKRSSSRFCRIYDKTYEMTKGELKPHIATMWQKVGLTGQIWRYEYQISQKWFAQHEISFDDIFSQNCLFNLFQKAAKNHFELKENTGKKELNKEKDVVFIDFSKVSNVLGAITGAIGKLTRTIKETFIGQQRMIKGLLRSYFSSNHDFGFLVPLKRMLNDFDLWEWYNQKFSQYIAEFKEKEKIKTINLAHYETDFNIEFVEI